MRDDLIKYIIFIFGGGLGFLVNFIITVLLTEVFGLWHMLSFSIGIIGNFLVNFFYHTSSIVTIQDIKI